MFKSFLCKPLTLPVLIHSAFQMATLSVPYADWEVACVNVPSFNDSGQLNLDGIDGDMRPYVNYCTMLLHLYSPRHGFLHTFTGHPKQAKTYIRKVRMWIAVAWSPHH